MLAGAECRLQDAAPGPGIRVSEAEVAQSGFGQHGGSHDDGQINQGRPGSIQQDVLEHDGAPGNAQYNGGFDVRQACQLERRIAYHPC